MAVILALTNEAGGPFDAVVLRDHVLLASSTSPARFYEVLAGGRELEIADASAYRRAGPAGPIRAHGAQFLPYYLDNLAARLAAAGREREAERAFEQALALGPGAARVRFNFGSFLVTQGRYEAGLGLLTAAIDSGWRDADAYVNRGVAQWALGHVGSARADFEAALDLDPHHPLATSHLSRLDENPRGLPDW